MPEEEAGRQPTRRQAPTRPALNFKDLHHPCWGGERAESGFYLPHGPAGRLFLQHSEERVLTDLAEGVNLDNAGLVDRKRCQLQRA